MDDRSHSIPDSPRPWWRWHMLTWIMILGLAAALFRANTIGVVDGSLVEGPFYLYETKMGFPFNMGEYPPAAPFEGTPVVFSFAALAGNILAGLSFLLGVAAFVEILHLPKWQRRWQIHLPTAILVCAAAAALLAWIASPYLHPSTNRDSIQIYFGFTFIMTTALMLVAAKAAFGIGILFFLTFSCEFILRQWRKTKAGEHTPNTTPPHP